MGVCYTARLDISQSVRLNIGAKFTKWTRTIDLTCLGAASNAGKSWSRSRMGKRPLLPMAADAMVMLACEDMGGSLFKRKTNFNLDEKFSGKF